MSKIFIQNPTDKNVGVQIISGDEFVLVNNGPDGAINTEGNRTGICLAPYTTNTTEATKDGTVDLEGNFVVQVDDKIIPFSFTPEQLPVFFNGTRPEALNVKFELKQSDEIEDSMLTKAIYVKTEFSETMWIAIQYIVEPVDCKLYIDWGDGNVEHINPMDYSDRSFYIYLEHNYVADGEYEIKLNSSTLTDLITISQITKVTNWGDPTTARLQLSSSNLVEVPTTLHPLMTNLNNLFHAAINFNQDISMWDTSKVVSMDQTFYQAFNFDQPLDSWDVSNVTAMGYAFYKAKAFNQPIGNWNTSKVIDMDYMFSEATNFNQDLSQWCVPLITTTPENFNFKTKMTEPNTPVWGTCPRGEVIVPEPDEMYFTTTAGEIYYQGEVGDVITLSDGTTILVALEDNTGTVNTVPAGKHKVKLVSERSEGYVGIGGVALIELNNFPTLVSVSTVDFCPNGGSPNLIKVPARLPSNITDLRYMFQIATNFNQNISRWDTSNVTHMQSMFKGATKFNQDISMWNTANVTNMSNMFNGATAFNQDLSQWCVGLIPSEPGNFNDNGVLPMESIPVWGTCPRGENLN